MQQRPADALRVASSIFSEGLTHLHAGRLPEALSNFEMVESINQKYLKPASLDNITCYQHIAAVHDKLGNLGQAAQYLERAKSQLSNPAAVPNNERGLSSRRRRADLMKQVQQRLDMMPRTVEPKVGAGVPLADLRALYASLSSAGDKQLASGDLEAAKLSFEQALALCRTHHHAISSAALPTSLPGLPGPLQEASALGNAAAVAIADTLARLAEVHSRMGYVMVAEAHLLTAIDVLTGDVLAEELARAEYAYAGPGPYAPDPDAAAATEPAAEPAADSTADASAAAAVDDEGEANGDASPHSLELAIPPSTPLASAAAAAARRERLDSLRTSLRSLHTSPAYTRASRALRTGAEPGGASPRSPMPSPLRPPPRALAPEAPGGGAVGAAGAGEEMLSPPVRASPLGAGTRTAPGSAPRKFTPHPPSYPPPSPSQRTSALPPTPGSAPQQPPPRKYTPRPPSGPPPRSPAVTGGAVVTPSQQPPATPASAVPSSVASSAAAPTPPEMPSQSQSLESLHATASSLALAAKSAVAAVGAAQAAQSAAVAVTSSEAGGGGPGTGGGAGAHSAEEDEFAWRAGQEEDDGGGPIDDRVEGAIEAINVARDVMTDAQLALDGAQRKLQATEAHTKAELTRLQEENAAHLAKMAAYEMAKAVSSEAAQAADEAIAKHGKAGAADELLRAKDTQAESMRMAMLLQETFDALVPYFVYRSVLESGLEETRQSVVSAQEEVRPPALCPSTALSPTCGPLLALLCALPISPALALSRVLYTGAHQAARVQSLHGLLGGALPRDSNQGGRGARRQGAGK